MKRKLLLGIGAGIATLASFIALKYLLDDQTKKLEDELLNDTDDNAEEDRGVSPIDEKEDSEDEVKNLKPDAINHGYHPINY